MSLVDYAFPPHPSAAALLASGATGVSRYLSYRTTSAAPKVLTAAEYAALRTAGLAVVLNWEYDGRDYRTGATGGADHAHEAITQAHALGYPAGCAIIGSADTDMPRSDWLTYGRPYYRAFAGALRAAGYRAGIYGPWDVLTWAWDDGVADVFWQAGMSTDWSGGRNAQLWPGAHLRQRRNVLIGGADCDLNDIIRSDYGQHSGGDVALKDDPDGVWLFPRIEAIALRQAPVEGPEKGQNLPVLQWMADVQTNAAKAASAAGTPAPVAMTDADRKAIIDGVSAQVGAKLDLVLARLAAAGHALDS